ncbi:MAG: MBL fold metallo-hydrolase [Polyangiales bacterium]
MRLHFIDVGQGAATLLEFGCGAVLIDTGGERQPSVHRGAGCAVPRHVPDATFDGSARLLAYLRAFFQRRGDLDGRLDAVYLTHPHVDHTRGAPEVLRAFHVGTLVTNGQSTGSGHCEQAEAEQLADAQPGASVVHVANPAVPRGLTSAAIDPVACADVDPELRVLFGRVDAAVAGPEWSATDLHNENEHSVVLRVGFGRFAALLMGDLQRQGIHDLLAQTEPALLDVDVLQVGHHGSHNATTAALLDALTPVTAVIAMGSPEREAEFSAWAFGHPRREVIDLLTLRVSGRVAPRPVRVATAARTFEEIVLEAAVFGTGWDGDVVIEAHADGTHARVAVLDRP